MKTIGITGGIGSGKSVVSRILRCKGWRVYDCDLEARRLMERDAVIQSALTERWGDSVCSGGVPDRREIASRVFGDEEELRWLNALVHGAVRQDIIAWIAGQEGDLAFVESAILSSSGLVKLCDAVISVEASEDVRIRRVIARSGMSEAEARRRIDAQRDEEKLLAESVCPVYKIENESGSLLDQLYPLIDDLKKIK